MDLSADTIFNVIFGLYAGLFTWLLFITKSQVKLVKEQTAQKDATIEYLKQVNKKLQEDNDPVKWKARYDLTMEILEREIAELKQLKDSESQEKVLALETVKKLSAELLATRQTLTEAQNQYNDSIIISGSAKLESISSVAGRPSRALDIILGLIGGTPEKT